MGLLVSKFIKIYTKQKGWHLVTILLIHSRGKLNTMMLYLNKLLTSMKLNSNQFDLVK